MDQSTIDRFNAVVTAYRHSWMPNSEEIERMFSDAGVLLIRRADQENDIRLIARLVDDPQERSIVFVDVNGLRIGKTVPPRFTVDQVRERQRVYRNALDRLINLMEASIKLTT